MEFTQKVLNGSMLEATEFRDWFYGTSIDELDVEKINVGVFNIAGIEALLADSRLEVIPVLVYAEDRIRLYRALMRERDPDCEEICRRFFADQKDFESIDFNYLIWENNGDATPLAVSDMTWLKQWSKIMEAFGQNPLD
jgi:guanylate kinase